MLWWGAILLIVRLKFFRVCHVSLTGYFHLIVYFLCVCKEKVFTDLYVHVYKGVNNQKIIVFIFKTYSHFTHQLVVLLDIYHEV